MKKSFSTISEFKRILEVGDHLKTTFHREHAGRDENGCLIFKSVDKGIRKVSIKQTNSFALKTKRTDGKITDSWCEYPKASKSKIENGILQIFEKDMRSPKPPGAEEYSLVLTYEFTDPESTEGESGIFESTAKHLETPANSAHEQMKITF